MIAQTENDGDFQRSRSDSRVNNWHRKENERKSRESSLQRPSRENSVLRKNIAPKSHKDLLQTALNHQILMKTKHIAGRIDSLDSSYAYGKGDKTMDSGLSMRSTSIGNIESTPGAVTAYRESRSSSSRPHEQSTTDNLFRTLSDTKSGSIDLGYNMYKHTNKEDRLKDESNISSFSSNVKGFYTSNASGNISNYQSESDDPSDSDEEVDTWTYPVIDNSTEMSSLSNIMKEINDFQNNFKARQVDSDRPYTPGKHSRVQQRILDYKELHSNESSTSLASMEHNTLFSAYDYKIQHETITNQYSSLRLRFPTKIISQKNQLKLDVGIWGFLNRWKKRENDITLKDLDTEFKTPTTPTSSSPSVHPVSSSEKDGYLTNLWSQELDSHFQSYSRRPSERDLHLSQTSIPVTPISKISQVAKSPLTN